MPARLRPLPLLLVALAVVGGACAGGTGGGADTAATTADEAATANGTVTGLLRLDPGRCGDGQGVTSGSWFRMVQSDGTVEDGPFVPNGDSPCEDTTWQPLAPGRAGGLLLGEYQPVPDPAFDDSGNARPSGITEPTGWFAVDFAVSTNATDPQTGTNTNAPSLTVTGTEVSGDLRAFAASWNGQHFNQGSPKPDGSTPGTTTPVSGTYDPDTGDIVIEWTSLIDGGPFDGFTGVWHLEGTLDD